jgi:serine/threonine-protein kinase
VGAATEGSAGVPPARRPQNDTPNADIRRTFGRYRLYDVIAAGGMATVHYGRLHGELGFARTVAVKRLHKDYARDPEFVAMFMDEARLTMRVQHPNVVQTLDVVAAEGEVLLVMEYVPAVSLGQLLRAASTRGERVPASIAAKVVVHVLRGLHAAHEATDEAGNPLDIVHRDVSPQNVLVGTDGAARVLDFGVAKATGRQQTTREGQVKGKFAYMAPEQVTGVCVTRQSDVFAASIVLWEALTGKRLFEAESETALLARVLSAPIPPPSTESPGLDAELDRIVLRGLARDLPARYPSAREMALDLEAHARLERPSQMTEWVERLAGDELARRAARVAEIESESRSERVSIATVLKVAGAANGANVAEEAPAVEGARRPRRVRALGWMGAAALGIAGAAAVVAARVAPMRTPPPLPVARATAATSAPETPSPVSEGEPAHASAAAASSASSKARAPAGTAGHAAVTGTVGTSSRNRCDPPYYVDRDGHLIYKPECFR